MAEIEVRPAARSECRTIAELYAISSDGVAQYIWSRLARPGDDLLEVGQRRYESETSAFSYRNCTVAASGDDIMGMLVAFPVDPDPDPQPSADPILAPYSRLEEPDSYYVCGVACFERYRGRGIGTRLMALAEAQARARGLAKLSLIVFEANAGALRLHQRLGYREVARAAVAPHPMIHHVGDALLMVKTLT